VLPVALASTGLGIKLERVPLESDNCFPSSVGDIVLHDTKIIADNNKII